MKISHNMGRSCWSEIRDLEAAFDTYRQSQKDPNRIGNIVDMKLDVKYEADAPIDASVTTSSGVVCKVYRRGSNWVFEEMVLR